MHYHIHKTNKILGLGALIAILIYAASFAWSEPSLHKNISPDLEMVIGLIKNLSLGYATSYIFFLIAIYLPERKKQQELAKNINITINTLKKELIRSILFHKEKASSVYSGTLPESNPETLIILENAIRIFSRRIDSLEILVPQDSPLRKIIIAAQSVEDAFTISDKSNPHTAYRFCNDYLLSLENEIEQILRKQPKLDKFTKMALDGYTRVTVSSNGYVEDLDEIHVKN